MANVCVACQQPTTAEQPYYCLQCFIPVSPYSQGKYLGNEQTFCGNCSNPLTDNQQAACTQCNTAFNLENLPTFVEGSDSKAGEDELSIEIPIAEAKEMVVALGIDHLPEEQQGVALSSLSRERMNFLSGEYNFSEAKTLSVLGSTLTNSVGENWSIQQTQLQLARVLIRNGHPIRAAKILQELMITVDQKQTIARLRFLEITALLALAHRLAGNSQIADLMVENTNIDLQKEFLVMEAEITQYLRKNDIKSEYLEFDNRQTVFPRVDYFAMILAILVEELIARGGKDDLLIHDDILDRMLELDNIVGVLAEMTPKDDPVFFAAQLREFTRLVSGLMWYGEVLLNNMGVKKRLLTDRVFERISQWIELIPVHFWLTLRLGRILEIFLRAEHWSKVINIQRITTRFLTLAPKDQQPSFLFTFAESLRNSQQFDQAISYLDQLLSYRYRVSLDPGLKSMAEQTKIAIELERMGILVGVSKESDLFHSPINLEMEQLRSSHDSGSYLEQAAAEELPELKKPILHLTFDGHQEILEQGVAIFGEKLAQVFRKFQSTVVSVKGKQFDDPSWNTPAESAEQPKEVRGTRMDVLIMRTRYNQQSLTLIFEGKKQRVIEDGDSYMLAPSDLLLLRGIIYDFEIIINDILQVLTDLLTSQLEEGIEIYTLKNRV